VHTDGSASLLIAITQVTELLATTSNHRRIVVGKCLAPLTAHLSSLWAWKVIGTHITVTK
jgi:hypothetical protein